MTLPSAQPRSVIFLGTAHDNGGSSILAAELAEAMRAHGHNVEEWYLFGSKISNLSPQTRIFCPQPRTRSPLVLAKVLLQVLSELRARKPDTIFGLQSLSNLVVGLGGRLTGIRNRVATLHQRKDHHNRTLMVLDRAVGSLGFYTRIIACAENVAETYFGHGEAYKSRLIAIVNGQKKPVMQPRHDARAKLGLPAEGLIVGQIGGFRPQKNQQFSVTLLRSLPDTHFHFLGSGPDEASIRAQVAATHLQERVHFVSALDHAHVGVFYSAVDAVLFPSLFEGLSLAAIEAIHAGVPLICSDIPSFRELFKDSAILTEALLVPLD